MIQLNEVRVGNWINGIALGQYHQVDAFFFHEWYDHIHCDDDTFGDWYEGIPLTPEILEKCGFVPYNTGDNDYSTYMIGDEDLFLEIDWRRREQGYNPIVKSDELVSIGNYVKHLHQLQNLYYSLTQTELKIQLQP